MSVVSPAASQPFIDQDDEDDESHNCRRCDLPISEGHAYELGGDRWHMYCFSCSKCSKLLGTSSNFLVLGTGDLICSDCSYACNACGKKIDDLAILTGDQAYCSTCFCCRNCKKRIEDLRYARTSKGLFCMSCHEKLLEKKKRHEQEKKSRMSQRNSKFTNFDKSLPKIPGLQQDNIPDRIPTPDSITSEISNPDYLETTARAQTATASLTPAIPPRSPNRNKATPALENVKQEATTTLEPALIVSSTMGTLTPQMQIGYKFEQQSTNSSLYEDSREIDSVTSEFAESINKEFAISESQNETSKQKDYLSSETPTQATPVSSPLRSSFARSPNGGINRQAVVVDSYSSGGSSNILSSYINNESPPPKIPPPKLPMSEDAKKSGLQRGLDYVEPNSASDDFIDLNDSDEEESKPIGHNLQKKLDEVLDEYKIDDNANAHVNDNDNANSYNDDEEEEKDDEKFKYKKRPNGFGQFRKSEQVPAGLNIKGFEGTENFNKDALKTPSLDQQPNTSPWKSSNQNHNLLLSPNSPSPSYAKKSALLNITNETPLNRNKSIRSPKAFLNNFTRKHKKSESNSSVDYKISSPFMTSENIQYNNDGVSTPIANPRSSADIVTSPYQGAALFTTPPVTDLPSHRRKGSSSSFQHGMYHHQYTNSQHTRSASSGTHVRSTSDAATVSYSARRSSNPSNVVAEVSEVRKLELELNSLKAEIRELKLAKFDMTRDINELSKQKDSLTSEVSSLTNQLNTLKIEESRSTRSTTTSTSHHQNSRSIDLNEHNKIDKSSIGAPIPAIETSNTPIEPAVVDTKQQKSRGKFWKRGNFFNKGEATGGASSGGISGSQSSYSLNNLLSDGSNGATKGNSAISAPLLKTDELDELGGNDNKKLLATNSNLQNNNSRYLDINSDPIGSSSSNSSRNNLPSSNSGLIMSDLFNSTLESRAIFEKRPIPLIVTRLVEEVEKRGLDYEGIYRKNGGTSQMNSILKAFNGLYQSETSQELEKVLAGDIAAVTSSLKRYFYHILPEPIISNTIYDDFINVANLNTKEDKIQKLKQLVNQLPQTNIITLRFLLIHIKKIESYKDQNKMTFHNLAVVFGPTFTRVLSGERELLDMKPRNETIEFMLSHSDDIF